MIFKDPRPYWTSKKIEPYLCEMSYSKNSII